MSSINTESVSNWITPQLTKWELSQPVIASLNTYVKRHYTYWQLLDNLTSNKGKLKYMGYLYEVHLSGKNAFGNQLPGDKTGKFEVSIRAYGNYRIAVVREKFA